MQLADLWRLGQQVAIKATLLGFLKTSGQCSRNVGPVLTCYPLIEVNMVQRKPIILHYVRIWYCGHSFVNWNKPVLATFPYGRTRPFLPSPSSQNSGIRVMNYISRVDKMLYYVF